MRVLQFGPWPPPYGGVQTHIVALHDRMRAAGIESEVINTTSAPATGLLGIHYPRSAPALLWLLLRRPADILHVHIGGTLSAELLGLCAVCNFFPGRRSVLTFHSGGFPGSEAGRRMRRRSVAARVLRGFDRIIVVNDEQRAFFLRLGCQSDHVRLILPHARLDPVQIASASVPEDLGSFMAAHDGVLVTVGLLEPEYDMPLVIEAAASLRQKLGNVGIVIVGSGSLDGQLRALVADSPERDHLHVTGDLPHAVTLHLIQQARMLIRATRYDGDAISVREALALGTPVVATDTRMRPAGCHLFPVGSLAGLVGAAATAMEGDRRSGDVGGDDLGKVLELYGELAS